MNLHALPVNLMQRLAAALDCTIPEIGTQGIGGGSINDTVRIFASHRSLFCKINSASKFPHLFEKESNGLNLIKTQKVVHVPEVVDCFEEEGYQVLLLEWIQPGERREAFWKLFGEQLATLHQKESGQFGLSEDNYMGSVQQSNRLTDNWIEFFAHQRIEPLLKKCNDRHLLRKEDGRQFEKLLRGLPDVFDAGQRPVLVHGDLWNGNFICNEKNAPVLIDPAAFYGHPAVDLGMTLLFGGFSPAFYEAYHYHSPFPARHEEQWQICNLYPLLIHLFLFGSSYLHPIKQTLSRFG